MIRFFPSTIRADGGITELNMVAFFSIRQLKGYTGNCLRVIRDSDLTTLDIGFVSGELDQSAITTFCTGTTGRVNRWYNQVDGSFASQATQANQPIIYTGGSIVTVNSKPAITFDVNDNLTLTGISWLSLFTVLKVDTFGTLNYMGNTATSPIFCGGSFSGANGFGFFESSLRISNTTENTNQNQHTMIKDTNFLAVDSNSSDYVSNTYNSSGALWALIGNATIGLRGKMQEIVLYSDNKSTNKLAIESNLQTYYGI
jgi:hypothetical protein